MTTVFRATCTLVSKPFLVEFQVFVTIFCSKAVLGERMMRIPVSLFWHRDFARLLPMMSSRTLNGW